MTLHEQLVAQGYVHTHHEADCEEFGNGETGPRVYSWPAYDEYTTDSERVIVVNGVEECRTPRDLAFEKWCDEQQECT